MRLGAGWMDVSPSLRMLGRKQTNQELSDLQLVLSSTFTLQETNVCLALIQGRD